MGAVLVGGAAADRSGSSETLNIPVGRDLAGGSQAVARVGVAETAYVPCVCTWRRRVRGVGGVAGSMCDPDRDPRGLEARGSMTRDTPASAPRPERPVRFSHPVVPASSAGGYALPW